MTKDEATQAIRSLFGPEFEYEETNSHPILSIRIIHIGHGSLTNIQYMRMDSQINIEQQRFEMVEAFTRMFRRSDV